MFEEEVFEEQEDIYTLEALNSLKTELLKYNWQGYAVLTFPYLPPRDGMHVLREKFFKKLARDSLRDMNVFWFYKFMPAYERFYMHFMIDLDYLPFKHVHYLWFYTACRGVPGYSHKRIGSISKVTWLNHEEALKKVNRSVSYLKAYGPALCGGLEIGPTYGFFHGKAGKAPSSKG